MLVNIYMSIYDRPNFLEPINTFNPSNWIAPDSALDINFLNANYLRYPTAQGDQTYTNLTATGALSIGGNATINTLQATTVGSAVSVYDTTTTGNITLGAGLTTGRLRIGGASNSNHIANLDFTNNTINNITAATGNINIGNSQVSGDINIGINGARTGNINIGSSTGSVSTITIGSTNTITNINGSTVSINGVNQVTANSVSSASNISMTAGLPSPYFITLTGASALIVNPPTSPYLGQKIIIYNSSTAVAGCAFTAASAILIPFGALITTLVTTINMPSNETTVFQWQGSYWVQQYKPNLNNIPTTINYITFTPSGFNQIGYSETYTQTPAVITTTGVKNYFLNTAGTMPNGLYIVSMTNRLTAGTTSGNVVNAFITGVSQTNDTGGLINALRQDQAASNLTFGASGVLSGQVSGVYGKASATKPSNIFNFNVVTIAGTGLQPFLTMTVMRFA